MASYVCSVGLDFSAMVYSSMNMVQSTALS